MTRHVHIRCRNCNTVYPYQTSGRKVSWYSNQSDSDRYCKDCWAVVVEALKAIPKKFVRVYTEVTDDAEKKRVYEREKEVEANPPKLMGLPIREVGSSTVRHDPETGKMSVATRTFPVNLDGVRYLIRRTYGDEKPDVIERETERNVETGAEKPWRNYRL